MAVKKTTSSTQFDGNVDLGFSVSKKKFTVGGDPNLIIEFDPSDLGVANRLSKALPEFSKLNEEWEKLNSSAEKFIESASEEEAIQASNEFSSKFDELETAIRKIIDEVFDGDVADKLLGNSSSFSPVNGYFKYEHIITAMLNCYEKQIQDEAPKFNSRKVQKYTHKYIKK